MVDPYPTPPNEPAAESDPQSTPQTPDVSMYHDTLSNDILMEDSTFSFDDFLNDDGADEVDLENIFSFLEAKSSSSPIADGTTDLEMGEAFNDPNTEDLQLADLHQQTSVELDFLLSGENLINGYVPSLEHIPQDPSFPAANCNTGTSEEQDLRHQLTQLSEQCSKLDQNMQQMQGQIQLQNQRQQRYLQQLRYDQMIQQGQQATLQTPFPHHPSPYRYNPYPYPYPRRPLPIASINKATSSRLGELNRPLNMQGSPTPFRGQANALPPQPTINPTLLQLNPDPIGAEFNFHLPSGSGGDSATSLNSLSDPTDLDTKASTSQPDDRESKGTADSLELRSRPLTRNRIPKTSRGRPSKILPGRKRRVTKAEKAKNNRTQKIIDFKPEDHYIPLSLVPEAWTGEESKCIFNYNVRGELIPGESFSIAQMTEYLYKHPLQSQKKFVDTKQTNGLRIWIQKAPTDAMRRFMNDKSVLCRFENCVVADRKILIGHPRLAFDEQSHKRARFDPFIYAGLVHLYCAERFLDFPKLVRDLDVQVDDRTLEQETDGANRMKLEFHMLRVARAFVKTCLKKTLPGGYPDPEESAQWHYRGTLCHRLWRAKLDHEFPVRAEARAVHGNRPTQWPNHLGDLERLELAKSNRRRQIAQVVEVEVEETDGEETDGEETDGEETGGEETIDQETGDQETGIEEDADKADDESDLEWIL
jgi:hypothetical protein